MSWAQQRTQWILLWWCSLFATPVKNFIECRGTSALDIVFSRHHDLSDQLTHCSPLNVHFNRRKVRHHSERDTTSPTRLAVDVERFRITFKRRLVPPVHTQLPKREVTTGDKRQRVVVLLELDVCVTWRPWLVDSSMVSERVDKLRSKLPPTKHVP